MKIRTRMIAVALAGGLMSLALGAPSTAWADTTTNFPATPASLGAIPDAAHSFDCAPAPLDVKFNVSGIASGAALTNVAASIHATHEYLGDLTVTLIAPSGESKIVFSRVGQRPGNSQEEMYGYFAPLGTGPQLHLVPATYTFSDTAPASPTMWQAAASADDTDGNLPAGSYRASTPGTTADTSGGANTLLTPAFAGATLNGVWTLRVLDCSGTAAGVVSGASLDLSTASPQTIDTSAIPLAGIVRMSMQLNAYGGGSGNPVTYVSTTPAVCTVTPTGVVTYLKAGTCSLTLSQAGDATHGAGTAVRNIRVYSLGF